MSRPGAPLLGGLAIAGLAFVAGTVLSVFGTQVGAAAAGYSLGRGHATPLAVTVGGLIGLWIGLVGGVLYFGQKAGAELGLRFRWPFDLLVGTIAGAGTQLVLIPLLYLPWEQADKTIKHRLENPAKTDTAAIHGAPQIVVLFIFLALLAPLVEELFFRGLVQGSLARRFGPAVGVAGSAVVFGLAHFQALQLPALILFGLVLALLAHRTGRLGPAIVAHATFNAITVISLTVTR